MEENRAVTPERLAIWKSQPRKVLAMKPGSLEATIERTCRYSFSATSEQFGLLLESSRRRFMEGRSHRHRRRRRR
jgi:hypothetical protein